MPTFAVVYHYVEDVDVIAQHRPIHREYLGDLITQGLLIAAGPTAGRATPSAHLLFNAESLEQVEALLDADPFTTEGVVTSREIYEWNVAIGALGGSNGN
jgi:hypothetical protein